MDIVVGSGPSGVAIAEALLAAGRKVLMLDAGLTLEPERVAQKQRLARNDPRDWTCADLGFLEGLPVPKGEVPAKRAFGSDFPYAPPPGATPIEALGTSVLPSFAQGGLSTVWGSALLPFRDRDTADWAINSQDLRDGYRAAQGLLPLSAIRDDLDAAFPLHRNPDAALPPSRQARRLFGRLNENKTQLSAEGLTFGRARLAVDAAACIACGLCLHGCPHDLIYAAGTSLARQRERGLAYKPGLIVRSVQESNDGIEVYAIRPDGSPLRFEASRVFLGAGVINTAEILLRSTARYDRPVRIRDAQYFLVPTITWQGTAGVEQERLTTLCQAFLELDDPALSPFTIHMQAYTYNDIFRDLLAAKVGPLRKILPMGTILGRLGVLQSYLHSDHSGTIDATLSRQGGTDRVTLVGRTQPATAVMIKAVVAKIRRLSRLTGLQPIAPMVEITEPGRGFHSGGTFPMARDPGDGQTDLIGRPTGFSRVHLVDSSTFPSIPATTITFAVMANAYRIGAAVAAAGLS